MNDDEENQFLSLRQLMSDPHCISVGALATAIEKHGIQGWDRFGRFCAFKPGSREVSDALECLSDEVAAESEPVFCQYPSEQSLGGCTGFDKGWMKSELPAFDTRTQPAPPTRRTKTDSGQLTIIAGLLAAIRGEFGNTRHPDFQSDEAIKALIADQMRDFHGAKKRTLDDCFAAANRLLKSTD